MHARHVYQNTGTRAAFLLIVKNRNKQSINSNNSNLNILQFFHSLETDDNCEKKWSTFICKKTDDSQKKLNKRNQLNNNNNNNKTYSGWFHIHMFKNRANRSLRWRREQTVIEKEWEGPPGVLFRPGDSCAHCVVMDQALHVSFVHFNICTLHFNKEIF